MEKREPLNPIGGDINWCSYCGKHGDAFQKLKTVLHDPATPLLGIYPKKQKQTQNDMCTPMFVTGLFIKAKAWKHPTSPSVDEWIKKLQFLYAVG